jgi:hypothetical protein
MQLHRHLLKSVFGKAALAAAALGGFLFFAGAPGAQAHDRDDCRRAVRYDDRRLRDAIEDHGYYSRQADHWRHERHEALERCWRGDRDDRWHRY